MPTQHVQPESHEILQDVAAALFKARKIVVVTGAGISTNSGIPVCAPGVFDGRWTSNSHNALTLTLFWCHRIFAPRMDSTP